MTITEIVPKLEPVAPDPFIATLEVVRPAPAASTGVTDARDPRARRRPRR